MMEISDFSIGDIIVSEDARWYGLITKQGITDRMVYVVWFHDDMQANGWFPINIIMKVSNV
jgi:hypothetical protein